MTDLQFGTWVSRIIRWALAAAFAWMAYAYKGMEFLYLFAAVVFITGFFVPKRCIDDSCALPDKEAG
jgi:hypothetical protein